VKYKAGDVIQIRSDLKKHMWYGDTIFVSAMESWLDKSVTIFDIIDNGYRIKEDGFRFYWTEEMFQGDSK